MTALEVLRAGPLTLVQDAGRPGLARMGVGAAGAFDRSAHGLAHRLVGNPDDAAGLEILLGGVALRPDADVWIAVTGAVGPLAVDGDRVEPHTAFRVAAGTTLEIGTADRGLRFALAVRGGVDVDPVLGSRSRDTLAALGPDPLRDGDLLPVGPPPAGPVPAVDLVPVDPPPAGPLRLALRPGPRAERFEASALAALVEGAFTVTPRSDRTGIRLEGPPLELADRTELPSEGMLPGALQVSPDGAITILGPDAPVTGGYPVVAVVTDGDLDALAQLRPGQPIAFHEAAGAAIS